MCSPQDPWRITPWMIIVDHALYAHNPGPLQGVGSLPVGPRTLGLGELVWGQHFVTHLLVHLVRCDQCVTSFFALLPISIHLAFGLSLAAAYDLGLALALAVALGRLTLCLGFGLWTWRWPLHMTLLLM